MNKGLIYIQLPSLQREENKIFKKHFKNIFDQVEYLQLLRVMKARESQVKYGLEKLLGAVSSAYQNVSV